MAMSQKEYVKNHGLKCPYCRLGYVNAVGPVDADGEEILQKVTCDNCHKEWIDQYKLAGFRRIESH